jgi:two-component system, LuxR family, sensor kinase FixL
MGQMAAAIAHELNQPLSAVNSYLSGIARLISETDDPAHIADALGKAREQNTRAGEIVRRLRDLVVKRDTNRRIESINEIVEQTLGLALVDAKLRGVKTRVLLAPDLRLVLVDKIQIGQVVLNIVRNAIEAMEGSLECNLTISTATDPDLNWVAVKIADTGPGLSSKIKERLFHPFVTTKDKGMGIGLSICHDIVESHGGSLAAESNEPNGTIFVIRLPSGDTAETV